MKTKLIIEFETKDMKKIVPEEFIGDEFENCPDDEELTKDIEQVLHNNFISFLKHKLEENTDDFQEWMMDDEAGVEGFDELKDYGDIKIIITEVKD